jgi:virginiamycin B lyase
VLRVDPSTNAVVATIPTGGGDFDVFHGPTRIEVGHGSVWVLDGRADCGCLHRIDPVTEGIVATIGLGTPTNVRVAPLGLAVTGNAVWVALRWGTENAPTGSVVRIDPATNQVVAVVGTGASPDGGGPTGITATETAVWVGVPSMRSVVRIDPATNAVVATIPGLSCGEGQLVGDGSGVWVSDCAVVRRIDASANSIARTIAIPGATGSGALGIARGFGSIWTQAGPLFRIDPAREAVVGTVPLDPALVWGEYSIAVGFDSLWVRQIDSIVRIRPT